MATYATKDNSTPLWNQNGGQHGSSPFTGASINVTGQPVNLPVRGWAYRLVEPSNAFVLIVDLVMTPAPSPPPSGTPARIVLTEPDGRQRIFDEVL